MQSEVLKNIPHTVRVSRRARRMRIAVYCDSSVVVTLPAGLDFSRAEKFIREKFSWILGALQKFYPYTQRPAVKTGRREFYRRREAALSLAKEKVLRWNQIYGFGFNRVNIKNQKTRWGSCSKKGNLNFNYRILDLPERLADYLVVHELCHLREFNHGKNFWALVERTMPDFKNLRRELRDFDAGL